jgi:hypothetical protein
MSAWSGQLRRVLRRRLWVRLAFDLGATLIWLNAAVNFWQADFGVFAVLPFLVYAMYTRKTWRTARELRDLLVVVRRVTIDANGRIVDLDDLGPCYFKGCEKEAQNLTEDGDRFCTEHLAMAMATAAILSRGEK